jgi:hypothetical protein
MEPNCICSSNGSFRNLICIGGWYNCIKPSLKRTLYEYLSTIGNRVSVDCSNRWYLACLIDRRDRNWRRDAQSLHTANLEPDYFSRTGSDYEWNSCRMAMGTYGRHSVAGWLLFGHRSTQQFPQRADLVLFRLGSTGHTLCNEHTCKTLSERVEYQLEADGNSTITVIYFMKFGGQRIPYRGQ